MYLQLLLIQMSCINQNHDLNHKDFSSQKELFLSIKKVNLFKWGGHVYCSIFCKCGHVVHGSLHFQTKIEV
jgi:hypothetical protein